MNQDLDELREYWEEANVYNKTIPEHESHAFDLKVQYIYEYFITI